MRNGLVKNIAARLGGKTSLMVPCSRLVVIQQTIPWKDHFTYLWSYHINKTSGLTSSSVVCSQRVTASHDTNLLFRTLSDV